MKLDWKGDIQVGLTCNLYYQLWSVICASWYIFDFPDRQHSVNHFAKYNMFSVQEIALRGGDKELASRVSAC